MTSSPDDKHDTIKLVELKDERSFLERFSIPPERMARKARYHKLMKHIRDAVEALDNEEITEVIEYLDLSRQDIEEIRKLLLYDTRERASLNRETDKYLKGIIPKRIWSAK